MKMKNYSELPVPIIHLIQSFLTHKEATQTTLVSKSWETAWLTRSIIDLDEDRVPILVLRSFAAKTFKRYEESNITVRTFRLCLNSLFYVSPPWWTSMAVKLRASDITIRLRYKIIPFPMPEVFASEHVLRLCLTNLIIGQLETVKCSRLKSLALTLVDLSIDSFRTIISSCPLIEELSVTSPMFKFSSDLGACISHHKLTSLDLSHVELDQLRTLFLSDLSSNFPVLKDLTITIDEEVFLERAQQIPVISSRSLEVFNFRLSGGGGISFTNLPRVDFDFPGIRKFTFEGSWMPNVSFSPIPNDQPDFHVSVTHRGNPSRTWFNQLIQFIKNLISPKIHLTLHIHGSDINVQKRKGRSPRKVEVLSIYTEEGLGIENFNSLLDGMFLVCRPKMITHYVDPSYSSTYQGSDDHNYRKITNNGLLLCRALKTQVMNGSRGLKNVYVQELQDEEWMPRTMDSILDDSASDQERIVRFRLKWKP